MVKRTISVGLIMPETLDGNTIYITLESDERGVIIARATSKEELTFSRLTRPDVDKARDNKTQKSQSRYLL